MKVLIQNSLFKRDVDPIIYTSVYMILWLGSYTHNINLIAVFSCVILQVTLRLPTHRRDTEVLQNYNVYLKHRNGIITKLHHLLLKLYLLLLNSLLVCSLHYASILPLRLLLTGSWRLYRWVYVMAVDCLLLCMADADWYFMVLPCYVFALSRLSIQVAIYYPKVSRISTWAHSSPCL